MKRATKRLIIGLVVLLFLTFMTAGFGIGGFFFSIGLFAVIFFAFLGMSDSPKQAEK